jgi:hypothetical protein
MDIKKRLIVTAFVVILIICGYVSYAGIFPYFGFPKMTIESVSLGLEDPLVVHFDRSVVQHKIESSFTIKPSVVGKIDWQGNNLVFKPLNPWEPGKDFQVEFQGMSRFAVPYDFRHNFSTEALPRVADYTPSDNATTAADAPIAFNMDKGSQNCRLDFKVVPEFNYTLSIDPDRKSFQLIPEQALTQDANYQVIAYESYQTSDNKDWYQREVANFQFRTLSTPEVQKIIPADKGTDVTEFQPIKIFFSKPMDQANWQNFIEITPAVQGAVQWEDDGKTFIYKPYRWAQDTTYAVKVKGGWRASDKSSLKQDFIASFHSFNASGIVGKLQTANNEPKINHGKYIDINLSKQLLTIFEDGTNMGTYRISSGKASMPTPTGMYNVLNKQRKRWSKEYHLFMPYWMQFTRAGHGIHELPEWPSGYKEGAAHLGTPVSHGCVRLGVGAAATVYNFTDVGTPVYTHR